MPLAKKTITTTLINEEDLSKFIHETYGHSYSVAGDEEWNRSTAHLYELTTSPLDGYQRGLLEKFMDGECNCRMLRVFLQDMVNQGWLTPGHYTIFTS